MFLMTSHIFQRVEGGGDLLLVLRHAPWLPQQPDVLLPLRTALFELDRQLDEVSGFVMLDLDGGPVRQHDQGGIFPEIRGPFDLGHHGAVGIEMTNKIRRRPRATAMKYELVVNFTGNRDSIEK